MAGFEISYLSGQKGARNPKLSKYVLDGSQGVNVAFDKQA